MIPVVKNDRAYLFLGDAGSVEQVLDAHSVDSLVTDPPAGIGFMGKDWDKDRGGRDGWIAWLTEAIGASFRVLKPGAYGLVWALPRTSHWTATALENAGFEIRDIHMHLFGTGFPKSLNIGEGRGTALKPAAEHWILVRKPLIGTVAANVLEHGTGAINIDACRIEGRERTDYGLTNATRTAGHTYGQPSESADFDASKGRWPAHLSLDEDAAAMLDAQSAPNMHSSGAARDGTSATRADSYDATSYQLGPNRNMRRLGDSGGASRFFYVAKPSRAERDRGCDHLTPRSAGEATDREDGSEGLQNPRAGAGRTGGARNFHPTVKSQALMRWLIRLITPPGGTVLDPFAGSCSTGVAALSEGCDFVGIEKDGAYIEIAKARLENAIEDVSKGGADAT